MITNIIEANNSARRKACIPGETYRATCNSFGEACKLVLGNSSFYLTTHSILVNDMFEINPNDDPGPETNIQGLDSEKSEGRQELPHGESSTESEPEEKKRTIRGFRWLIICISLYVTCFLYGLDTTIAADVQGPVTEAFGQVDQLAWIGAGFPLGSVCVILLLGTLYNSFNIKWVFIATVVLFEAGSALCGAAPNSKFCAREWC